MRWGTDCHKFHNRVGAWSQALPSQACSAQDLKKLRGELAVEGQQASSGSPDPPSVFKNKP